MKVLIFWYTSGRIYLILLKENIKTLGLYPRKTSRNRTCAGLSLQMEKEEEVFFSDLNRLFLVIGPRPAVVVVVVIGPTTRTNLTSWWLVFRFRL